MDLCSKEMSKIIVPLYVMSLLKFFWCWQKNCVQTSPEKYRSLYIFETTLENLNKLLITHIYSEKVSTTLTEMRAQKRKNMNDRKAQTFPRIGPDVDSNFHRNERVIYYTNVLLHFQNPASRICPLNHLNHLNRYQILNGLCQPIMHSKFPLLDELVKRVNR